MDLHDKGAVPTPSGAEQDDCLLTAEQTREITIHTMASWALDDLYPSPKIVERINAYLRGDVTMDEYLDELRRLDPAETTAAVFRALESVDGDVSPQLARSVQAQINLVKQIGREFGLLTEDDAQAALGQVNATDLRYFGVRYRCETLLPGFLSVPSPGGEAPMGVRPLLEGLKEIASEYGWSGQSTVFWMTFPATFFADHGRPVDHLHEPAKVVSAFTDAAGAQW